jgi:parallel beta-helix repeat protein
MTISTAPAPLSYNGDDSTVDFPITWKYFAKAHVVATLRSTTGAETTQTLTTHYTLTPAGVAAGGTLTMVTAPATNETLVIELEPSNTQDSSLALGGAFPSSAVEAELDEAAQRDAKIEAVQGRTFKVPKTDTQTGSLLELPVDSLRASKAFHFDSNGKPSMVEPADASGTNVTSASGTQARSHAERADDVFSVKDYGSTLNGATLQAAIDAAELNGGGAVEIPSNTTIAIGTTEITIGSNITLFGHGDSSIISATGAGRTNTDDMLRNDDQASGNTNIRFMNFRIFGDRSTQTDQVNGIDLQNCSECLVQNVTFADHGVGVWLASCVDTTITGNFFVEETANKTGVVLEKDTNVNERIIITNNVFNGTDQEAIDINNGSIGVVIGHNTFFNNHTADDDGTAEETEVIDVGSGNLDINDILIIGNVFDLNLAARVGIWVKQDTTRVSIVGNTIRDGQDNVAEVGAGIRLSNSSQISITGNIIENMRRGIHVTDASSTTTSEGISIVGNQFRDMTVECIDFTSGATATRSVSIIGNVLDGVTSTEEGIVIDNTNGCLIQGNDIFDFDKDGILLVSGAATVTVQGNSIRNNGGDGVDISAAVTGLNISNNIFAGNTGEDINSPTNAAAGSVIRDNSPDEETATGTFTLNPIILATNIDSSGGAVTGTLGSGVTAGDQKLIVMTEASNSSTVSVTNHVTSDPEVFTFDAVDEALLLQWTGTEWMTVHIQDATTV